MASHLLCTDILCNKFSPVCLIPRELLVQRKIRFYWHSCFIFICRLQKFMWTCVLLVIEILLSLSYFFCSYVLYKATISRGVDLQYVFEVVIIPQDITARLILRAKQIRNNYGALALRKFRNPWMILLSNTRQSSRKYSLTAWWQSEDCCQNFNDSF